MVADSQGVTALERISGNLNGVCLTRYQVGRWIVWQVMETDSMRYRYTVR